MNEPLSGKISSQVRQHTTPDKKPHLVVLSDGRMNRGWRNPGGGGGVRVTVCLILPGHPSVFPPCSYSTSFRPEFHKASLSSLFVNRKSGAPVKRRSLKPEVALSTGSLLLLLLRERRRLVPCLPCSPSDKGTRSTEFMWS